MHRLPWCHLKLHLAHSACVLCPPTDKVYNRRRLNVLRLSKSLFFSGMKVGFQKDSKWMYSGSEDGTIKIWDLRAPGCQREYASRAAVNTVVLHPNQGELISGDSPFYPSHTDDALPNLHTWQCRVCWYFRCRGT